MGKISVMKSTSSQWFFLSCVYLPAGRESHILHGHQETLSLHVGKGNVDTTCSEGGVTGCEGGVSVWRVR